MDPILTIAGISALVMYIMSMYKRQNKPVVKEKTSLSKQAGGVFDAIAEWVTEDLPKAFGADTYSSLKQASAYFDAIYYWRQGFFLFDKIATENVNPEFRCLHRANLINRLWDLQTYPRNQMLWNDYFMRRSNLNNEHIYYDHDSMIEFFDCLTNKADSTKNKNARERLDRFIKVALGHFETQPNGDFVIANVVRTNFWKFVHGDLNAWHELNSRRISVNPRFMMPATINQSSATTFSGHVGGGNNGPIRLIQMGAFPKMLPASPDDVTHGGIPQVVFDLSLGSIPNYDFEVLDIPCHENYAEHDLPSYLQDPSLFNRVPVFNIPCKHPDYPNNRYYFQTIVPRFTYAWFRVIQVISEGGVDKAIRMKAIRYDNFLASNTEETFKTCVRAFTYGQHELALLGFRAAARYKAGMDVNDPATTAFLDIPLGSRVWAEDEG